MVSKSGTLNNLRLMRLKAQKRNKNLRPRTKSSWKFFQQRIKDMKSANPKAFMMDPSLISRGSMVAGRVMYFEYEAITKNLEYWDKYPMTLIISFWSENGKVYFDGINFHYLPPELRYDLMIKLYQIRNNNRYDSSTKFLLTYETLMSSLSFSMYRKAYKKYLLSQVKSNIYQVESKYLEIALNMPLARWVGNGGNSKVWSDTLKDM